MHRSWTPSSINRRRVEYYLAPKHRSSAEDRGRELKIYSNGGRLDYIFQDAVMIQLYLVFYTIVGMAQGAVLQQPLPT